MRMEDKSFLLQQMLLESLVHVHFSSLEDAKWGAVWNAIIFPRPQKVSMSILQQPLGNVVPMDECSSYNFNVFFEECEYKF